MSHSMKQKQEQQLQIGQFIKEPTSLKLLILAGTNIRPAELATVNQCSSLIKLDLSSNHLAHLPLAFHNFNHLRILYLHDNQLTSVLIQETPLEYISLFDNPINNYRQNLIAHNPKLIGIDLNVISQRQRATLGTPHPSTALKWPIVQISQSLQKEEDYLNLLKAQLFVIMQIYRKALAVQIIEQYLSAYSSHITYTLHPPQKKPLDQQSLYAMGQHWLNYTVKKRKLRKILSGTSGEQLLLNRLQRCLRNRSPGVDEVMRRFMASVRIRMIARRMLSKAVQEYRLRIPALHQFQARLLKFPLRLYCKQSQLFYLQKILLFSKKIYFNNKNYDICDNYDQLAYNTGRSFFILRGKQQIRDCFLGQMIADVVNMVIAEDRPDRKSILYNRKGHKAIQIKRVSRAKIPYNKTKKQTADGRLQRLYSRYDKLIEFNFKSQQLFLNILRIIRYFNAGNAGLIMKNQAAYFQTEVVDNSSQRQDHPSIFVGCFGIVERVRAANVIQRWWRQQSSIRKAPFNLLKQIKKKRAANLIGRWLRDLRFRHRQQLNKLHSFMSASCKNHQLYLQMDVYMNLPQPTNILGYSLPLKVQKSPQYLYQVLHTKTQVEIVENASRKWIKFKFLSVSQALQAQKILSKLTYRFFFNGTFLKLFTHFQLHSADLLQYQQHIQQLFKITINSIESTKAMRRVEVQSEGSFFVWLQMELNMGGMFKAEQTQSLPISVFIYNKNKRPLKVSCDLMWVHPSSLYYFRTKPKAAVRIHTPKKEKEKEIQLEWQLPHIRHKQNRLRQNSMKQHKSLLSAQRKKGHSEYVQLSLLSQTMNIKRT